MIDPSEKRFGRDIETYLLSEERLIKGCPSDLFQRLRCRADNRKESNNANNTMRKDTLKKQIR